MKINKKLSIFIILIIIVISIFLYIFIAENNKVDSYLPENIQVTIKEGSLSTNSLILIINNDSDYELIYGADFEIEKKHFGIWHTLKSIQKEIKFPMPAYIIKENEQKEILINWLEIYGTLEKGKYRIVKKINDYYFKIEFLIE